MTAPNPADDLAKLSEASGDPEAFRLVYSALMQRYDDSCRVGHMTQFADEVAAHAVQVLRAAGRLLPPDTRPEVEYAIQGEGHAKGTQWTSEPYYRREMAERRALDGDAVVERRIFAGPWAPVPATKETP